VSSASPLVRPGKARLALMTGTLTMSDPNHDAAFYAVLEEFEQLVAKELRGRQAIQRPDGSLKVDPTKVYIDAGEATRSLENLRRFSAVRK